MKKKNKESRTRRLLDWAGFTRQPEHTNKLNTAFFYGARWILFPFWIVWGVLSEPLNWILILNIVLQVLPAYTVTGGYPSKAVTLSICIVVAIIKLATLNGRRLASDRRANGRPVRVLTVDKTAKELKHYYETSDDPDITAADHPMDVPDKLELERELQRAVDHYGITYAALREARVSTQVRRSMASGQAVPRRSGVEGGSRYPSSLKVSIDDTAVILEALPPHAARELRTKLKLLQQVSSDSVLDHTNFYFDWDLDNKMFLRECQHLRIGDIVVLCPGDEVPADCLILDTTNDAGVCYVESSQLDGESHLKPKQMPEVFRQLALKYSKNGPKYNFLSGRISTLPTQYHSMVESAPPSSFLSLEPPAPGVFDTTVQFQSSYDGSNDNASNANVSLASAGGTGVNASERQVAPAEYNERPQLTIGYAPPDPDIEHVDAEVEYKGRPNDAFTFEVDMAHYLLRRLSVQGNVSIVALITSVGKDVKIERHLCGKDKGKTRIKSGMVQKTTFFLMTLFSCVVVCLIIALIIYEQVRTPFLGRLDPDTQAPVNTWPWWQDMIAFVFSGFLVLFGIVPTGMIGVVDVFNAFNLMRLSNDKGNSHVVEELIEFKAQQELEHHAIHEKEMQAVHAALRPSLLESPKVSTHDLAKVQLDEKKEDEEEEFRDFNATVNNPSVLEDLAVSHIVSDKTGTLTQNKMFFRGLSLGDGVAVYGLTHEGGAIYDYNPEDEDDGFGDGVGPNNNPPPFPASAPASRVLTNIPESNVEGDEKDDAQSPGIPDLTQLGTSTPGTVPGTQNRLESRVLVDQMLEEAVMEQGGVLIPKDYSRSSITEDDDSKIESDLSKTINYPTLSSSASHSPANVLQGNASPSNAGSKIPINRGASGSLAFQVSTSKHTNMVSQRVDGTRSNMFGSFAQSSNMFSSKSPLNMTALKMPGSSLPAEKLPEKLPIALNEPTEFRHNFMNFDEGGFLQDLALYQLGSDIDSSTSASTSGVAIGGISLTQKGQDLLNHLKSIQQLTQIQPGHTLTHDQKAIVAKGHFLQSICIPSVAQKGEGGGTPSSSTGTFSLSRGSMISDRNGAKQNVEELSLCMRRLVQRKARDMMANIALNNEIETCLFDPRENKSDTLLEVKHMGTNSLFYFGTSPDELALVAFASEVGCSLTRRDSTTTAVDYSFSHDRIADLVFGNGQFDATATTPLVFGPTAPLNEARIDAKDAAASGPVKRVDILKTFPFDSTRKRMSVIVKLPGDPEEVVRMLSKGADTSILPFCVFDRYYSIYRDYCISEGLITHQSNRASRHSRPSAAMGAAGAPLNAGAAGASGGGASSGGDGFAPFKGAEDVLDAYANQGWRTLSFSQRIMKQEKWNTFFAEYNDIPKIVEQELGLDVDVEKLRKEIEERQIAAVRTLEEEAGAFEYLGSTAVEDVLQEGLEGTLKALRNGGITVWVLTGDKVETAVAIALSCNLITRQMSRVVLNSEYFKNLARTHAQHLASVGEEEVRDKMADIICLDLERIKVEEINFSAVDSNSLVIDGQSLELFLGSDANPKIAAAFLEFVQGFRVLVACRVTPRQKAELTSVAQFLGFDPKIQRKMLDKIIGEVLANKKMVEEKNKTLEVPEELPALVTHTRFVSESLKKGRRVLAIGDGANDAPMIERANVGIGIRGKEGGLAAQVADVSIGKFRDLERLVFIYGHESIRTFNNMIQQQYFRMQVAFGSFLFFAFIDAAGNCATNLVDEMLAMSVLGVMTIHYVGTLMTNIGLEKACNNLDDLCVKTKYYRDHVLAGEATSGGPPKKMRKLVDQQKERLRKRKDKENPNSSARRPVAPVSYASGIASGGTGERDNDDQATDTLAEMLGGDIENQNIARRRTRSFEKVNLDDAYPDSTPLLEQRGPKNIEKRFQPQVSPLGYSSGEDSDGNPIPLDYTRYMIKRRRNPMTACWYFLFDLHEKAPYRATRLDIWNFLNSFWSGSMYFLVFNVLSSNVLMISDTGRGAMQWQYVWTLVWHNFFQELFFLSDFRAWTAWGLIINSGSYFIWNFMFTAVYEIYAFGADLGRPPFSVFSIAFQCSGFGYRGYTDVRSRRAATIIADDPYSDGEIMSPNYPLANRKALKLEGYGYLDEYEKSREWASSYYLNMLVCSLLAIFLGSLPYWFYRTAQIILTDRPNKWTAGLYSE